MLGFQHLTNAARLLLIAAQAEAHHRAEGFVGTDHVLLAAVNRTSHGCPELYALTRLREGRRRSGRSWKRVFRRFSQLCAFVENGSLRPSSK